MIFLLVGDAVSHEKLHTFSFTDSDHLINYNGANVWIYKYMAEQLYEEVKRNPDGKSLTH